MTPLRQRMIEDMQIRNYSPRTIECYTYHVRCFAEFCGRSPEKLGPEEIRDYQIHLVQHKRASWSHFNQAVCALRFLYRKIRKDKDRHYSEGLVLASETSMRPALDKR